MRPPRFFAASSVSSAHGRTWPWAVGSIASVVLVLGATLIGHAIVSSRHAPPLTVAAPSLPPLSVVASTPSGLSAQLVALDGAANHLVALTTRAAPVCPPVGACPAVPLQSFTVFDARTGAVLTSVPLTGAAASASRSVLLLAGAGQHFAYAVAPQSVDVFSTVTGQRLNGYALPGVPWSRESGGALDAAHGQLILAGDGALEALDAATGHPLAAWRAPAGTARTDGPVVDAARGLVYLLVQPVAGQPSLVSLDTGSLAQVGQAVLPAGSRLGPLNTTTRMLSIFGTRGAPCRYTVSTAGGLALAPSPNAASGCDVSAAGWNADLEHSYGAEPSGIVVRDANTGRSIAALPVRVTWPETEPLLVDGARSLVYLPDEHGTVLIARDSAQPAALSVGSAVVLARAAMGRFLPNTSQNPPFVASESFPAAPGTAHLDFWVDYSDIGWRGPYAGAARTAATAAPGQPGAYLVTFSITWYQVFQRQHSWVCVVAPDGGVLLRSETGDAVP